MRLDFLKITKLPLLITKLRSTRELFLMTAHFFPLSESFFKSESLKALNANRFLLCISVDF